MASKTASIVYRFGSKAHRYQQGYGAKIPEHWHKWRRWTKPPRPVHWIPEEGKYKINPKTGERDRIQNVPIYVKFPRESQSALWGGEGVIKGYRKKKDKKMKPKVGKEWKPQLFTKTFYSEILDRNIGPISVTRSTLDQIDDCFGFDFYILKTPREDLRSKLGEDLKRHMLLKLARKDELYPEDEEKREKIYNRYKEFIVPEEEAEWIGLSYAEAIKKVKAQEAKDNPIRPLVDVYTEELVVRLREQGLEGPDIELDEDSPSRVESVRKWIFGKKSEDPEKS
ncbi:large ribosomal subunit protein bL28m-like [Ptychodera flava]|uniref:large ribosomal subunit protein bL28m-like n=1 Tax=Ptychodera flava TaxID=63121 RepID=UPI00396A957E